VPISRYPPGRKHQPHHQQWSECGFSSAALLSRQRHRNSRHCLRRYACQLDLQRQPSRRCTRRYGYGLGHRSYRRRQHLVFPAVASQYISGSFSSELNAAELADSTASSLASSHLGCCPLHAAGCVWMRRGANHSSSRWYIFHISASVRSSDSCRNLYHRCLCHQCGTDAHSEPYAHRPIAYPAAPNL
jgi:hypothetical protein